MQNIRNFCIIAHIDHGKSTLADRMLELTHTIETRKMKDQILDSMELEREKGITIKMQPVRMKYAPPQPLPKREGLLDPLPLGGRDGEGAFVLNLIDTPGHIDFSYEVSRALSAVEGAVLLVDSTQGVQAQTLTVLNMARSMNLKIIPALSKTDSTLSRIEEVKDEVVAILGCNRDEILETSGRTGKGVAELLEKIATEVPPPSGNENAPLKALVFDFKYSNHRGISVFVRVVDGKVSASNGLIFRVAGEKFTSLETGVFLPIEKQKDELVAGEIGYIVTGIKEPGIVSVGDTIGKEKENAPALHGYQSPKPVVWASIFPEDQSDLVNLRQALGKLKLTDSSLYFEEESSGVLGKGFRSGFLGMLHLEIITERLKREFNLDLVITQPSINYEISYRNGNTEKIYSPSLFPEDGVIEKVEEPWIVAHIITPSEYVGNILPLLYEYEAEVLSSDNFGGDRADIKCNMPLRELMRGFFDKIKSASSGYASLSYEDGEVREASVTKLAVLISGEEEPVLARVVSKRIVEREAEKLVTKLKEILPRQMFEVKIQAKAMGRIISSATLSAFRKDVTQHMYGGDITRKMKLREKQKKGKKKMKERGRMNIPHDVFIKIMKPD